MARWPAFLLVLLIPGAHAQVADWTAEIELDNPQMLEPFTTTAVHGSVTLRCAINAYSVQAPPSIAVTVETPEGFAHAPVPPLEFEQGLCEDGITQSFELALTQTDRIVAWEPQVIRLTAEKGSQGPNEASVAPTERDFVVQVDMEGDVIIEPVAETQRATTDPRFHFHIDNDSNADLRLLPTIKDAPFKLNGDARPIMLPLGASGVYELELPITSSWDAGPLIVEWQVVHMFAPDEELETETTEITAVYSKTAGPDGEMEAPGPMFLLPLLAALVLRRR